LTLGQEMTAASARFDQVSEWLELIEQLPLGHPDRLRYLTQAEELLENARPENEPADPEISGAD
jgi:hypothetical protein